MFGWKSATAAAQAASSFSQISYDRHPLAAVVQHLHLLEQCALVRTEKVGRTRMCHMEPAGLSVVEKWITDRRSSWERKFDRLGELLATEELPDVDP
jgi:hypothetical protein